MIGPAERPRLVDTAAWVIGGATGATLMGLLTAPYVGRAGVALLGAVVIATIGAYRGLAAGSAVAILQFLAFSYFIGERRFTDNFDVTRHVPQFALFMLVALISGTLAARLRAKAGEARRLKRQLQALATVSRRLASAVTPAQVINIVRSSGFEQAFRLYLYVGGSLEEVEPLAVDDAGRAGEAAEVAWMAGHARHRVDDIWVAALAPTDRIGLLVVSEGTARAGELDAGCLEALAGVARMALDRCLTGARPAA